MKRKSLIITTAVLMLFIMVFSGCTNIPEDIIYLKDTDKVETTNISFFGYKYDERDLVAFDNAIRRFMKDNPEINVSYEGLINNTDFAENYYAIFDLRRERGSLDEVFMLKQDYIAKLQATNSLADISNDIDLDAFNGLVRSQIQKTDGSIYFVPLALTSYCMYVNYDVLKADNQKVPENIEEFRAVCDFYVQKYRNAGENLAPIICNNNRSLRTLAECYGLYDLYQLPNSTQVIDGFNTDPLPLIDNYLKKGIEFVADFIQKGYINAQQTAATAQTTATEGGDLYEFMKGKQPFMISGSWATSRITKTSKGKNMNYGVHPLPVLEASKGGMVIVMDIDLCTAVNAHSSEEKLAAARKFISYFSRPEAVWEYCNNNNSYSPLANETRIPDDKTLAPQIPYYTNGQSVLGTNYRLNFDSPGYLKKALAKLLEGQSAQQAYEYLKQSILNDKVFGG